MGNLKKFLFRIEKVVIAWVHQMRGEIAMSGPIIRQKAMEVAVSLGYDDFTASEGWFGGFKSRNGISWRRPVEGADKADDQPVAALDEDSQMSSSDVTTSEDEEDEEDEPESKVEVRTKLKVLAVDVNQCRVCKSAEHLVNIFAIDINEEMRISDIIMKVCPSIHILERDSLPRMICLGCLERLRTAYRFVKDVQATDKELRRQLKRVQRNFGDDCDEMVDGSKAKAAAESSTDSDDSHKTKPSKKLVSQRFQSNEKPDAGTKIVKSRDNFELRIDESLNEKNKEKRMENSNKTLSTANFQPGEIAQVRTFESSFKSASRKQFSDKPYSCDCEKCRRFYSTAKRNPKHQGKSLENESSARNKISKPTDRNLFETFAPVNSTYWSDSFSE